jgi:hypothetical protein
MHGWMFYADMAFALELMVILFAIALLFAFKVYGKTCCKFGCLGVKLVLALGILALGCTSFYSVKHWVGGPHMRMHRKHSGMCKKCKKMKTKCVCKKNMCEMKKK